jgi:hypothetical protein
VNKTSALIFSPAALTPDPDMLPDPYLIERFLRMSGTEALAQPANTVHHQPYSLVSLHNGTPGLLFASTDILLVPVTRLAQPECSERPKKKPERHKKNRCKRNTGRTEKDCTKHTLTSP